MLAWTAQAVAPGARITQAAGLRDGGNPWLLRLQRAGREYRAVLKTGDPASARDRMQLRTQVAALALACDRGLPAPRVIAADLAGTRPAAGHGDQRAAGQQHDSPRDAAGRPRASVR